ncbi:MAG: hypothetical protein HYY51_00435 [Candidatus Magasanikbacteria bacterium]|nr:hypothetical protein [Candidatus Magasanikbacteria bacterium]
MTSEMFEEKLNDILDIVIFIKDTAATKEDIRELRSELKADTSVLQQQVSILNEDMCSVKAELSQVHYTLDKIDIRFENLETKVHEDGGLFAREIVVLKKRVKRLEVQKSES